LSDVKNDSFISDHSDSTVITHTSTVVDQQPRCDSIDSKHPATQQGMCLSLITCTTRIVTKVRTATNKMANDVNVIG